MDQIFPSSASELQSCQVVGRLLPVLFQLLIAESKECRCQSRESYQLTRLWWITGFFIVFQAKFQVRQCKANRTLKSFFVKQGTPWQ